MLFPGGTGYLKTLYQEKDEHGLEGEGIIQVMRLARAALETCRCRQLRQDPGRDDPDGCYRCIRTYHLQYNAARISRERGITLLGRLIEAGERRLPQQELDSIRPDSLFGSMLEKKFVDRLRDIRRGKAWDLGADDHPRLSGVPILVARLGSALGARASAATWPCAGRRRSVAARFSPAL